VAHYRLEEIAEGMPVIELEELGVRRLFAQ
jgi:hypothetical protein